MSDIDLNSKPVKQGKSVGMEGEDYIVALNDKDAYLLNPAAYYIWSLCDGNRSVEDIIAKVSEELMLSKEDVETPVIDILKALSENNLVVVEPKTQD
jgi:hypothetical protein